MTELTLFVYGLRCTDRAHRGHYGVVYATSRDVARMRSLAAGIRCNEVVISVDGGATWSRAES